MEFILHNIVGKEGNAGQEHFLLSPTLFPESFSFKSWVCLLKVALNPNTTNQLTKIMAASKTKYGQSLFSHCTGFELKDCRCLQLSMITNLYQV